MRIYAITKEQDYANNETIALFSERIHAEIAVKASRVSCGSVLSIKEFELDEWIEELNDA